MANPAGGPPPADQDDEMVDVEARLQNPTIFDNLASLRLFVLTSLFKLSEDFRRTIEAAARKIGQPQLIQLFQDNVQVGPLPPRRGDFNFKPGMAAAQGQAQVIELLNSVVSVTTGDAVFDRSHPYSRCDVAVVPSGVREPDSQGSINPLDALRMEFPRPNKNDTNRPSLLKLCISDRRPCTWDAQRLPVTLGPDGRLAPTDPLANRLVDPNQEAESHYVIKFVDAIGDGDVCHVEVRRYKMGANRRMRKSFVVEISQPAANPGTNKQFLSTLSPFFMHILMAQFTDRQRSTIFGVTSPRERPRPVSVNPNSIVENELARMASLGAGPMSLPWYFKTARDQPFNAASYGVTDYVSTYATHRLYCGDRVGYEVPSYLYSRIDAFVCSLANSSSLRIAILYERRDEKSPWRAYLYEMTPEAVELNLTKPKERGEEGVNTAIFKLKCKVLKRGGPGQGGMYATGPNGNAPKPGRSQSAPGTVSDSQDAQDRAAQDAARARQEGRGTGGEKRTLEQQRMTSPVPQVRRANSPARARSSTSRESAGGDYQCIRWTHGLSDDGIYEPTTLHIKCTHQVQLASAPSVEVDAWEPTYTMQHSSINVPDPNTLCFRDPDAVSGGLRSPNSWNGAPGVPNPPRHMKQALWGFSRPTPPGDYLKRALYVNPVLWEYMRGQLEVVRAHSWEPQMVNDLSYRMGSY